MLQEKRIGRGRKRRGIGLEDGAWRNVMGAWRRKSKAKAIGRATYRILLGGGVRQEVGERRASESECTREPCLV